MCHLHIGGVLFIVPRIFLFDIYNSFASLGTLPSPLKEADSRHQYLLGSGKCVDDMQLDTLHFLHDREPIVATTMCLRLTFLLTLRIILNQSSR